MSYCPRCGAFKGPVHPDCNSARTWKECWEIIWCAFLRWEHRYKLSSLSSYLSTDLWETSQNSRKLLVPARNCGIREAQFVFFQLTTDNFLLVTAEKIIPTFPPWTNSCVEEKLLQRNFIHLHLRDTIYENLGERKRKRGGREAERDCDSRQEVETWRPCWVGGDWIQTSPSLNLQFGSKSLRGKTINCQNLWGTSRQKHERTEGEKERGGETSEWTKPSLINTAVRAGKTTDNKLSDH